METASRLALKTPIVGWMIHDAINGLPDAKYYFGINIVLLIAILTYVIGFPFLITVADIAALSALGFVIYMSAADAFSAASREYQRKSTSRREPI